MHDSNITLPVHDDDLRDGVLFHELKSPDGQCVFWEGLWRWVHQLVGLCIRAQATFHGPPHVSVRDDANDRIAALNGRGAAAASAHFQGDLLKACIVSDGGILVGTHDILQSGVKALSKGTTWVHLGKIGCFEPARLHEAGGQRISHCHLCRSARCRAPPPPRSRRTGTAAP